LAANWFHDVGSDDDIAKLFADLATLDGFDGFVHLLPRTRERGRRVLDGLSRDISPMTSALSFSGLAKAA
jgi:hypothetical protein